MFIIPKEYHSRARVTLKATAGLRMISDNIASRILRNVIIISIKKIVFNLNFPKKI